MERNQALQQYTGWLHTVARNMTDDSLHDDLVQEGYIAMWRALGTYNPDKGALDYWLKRSATNRMRSVVTGETMTTNQEKKSRNGTTQIRGNETRGRIEAYIQQNPNATGVVVAKALDISQGTLSYHRSKMGTVTVSDAMTKQTVSIDAMTEVGWELEGPDHLDDVEVSYHAGEICEALDVLTPAQRKYVVARFWGGQTNAELCDLFGYDPSSLWRTAKPRLKIRLAYLRELVRN